MTVNEVRMVTPKDHQEDVICIADRSSDLLGKAGGSFSFSPSMPRLNPPPSQCLTGTAGKFTVIYLG